MNENEVPTPTTSNREKRKEYKDMHEQRHRHLFENREEARANFIGILDFIEVPENVDMNLFHGTENELQYAMERLYANNGRDFNPKMDYPPSMIYNFGKDYALNAQGIYYRDHYSEDSVICDRKIWIPADPGLSKMDRKNLDTILRKSRADVLASHSRNNEMWCKSEYAWEADAWSDIFCDIRDDPCLAIDKHSYKTLVPDIDPILCKLTGNASFVKRTPDATFGLATFTEGETKLSPWTSDLLWERLEHLKLHPKYGLISDPSRTETGLVFPFMVYEAKGWGGDCRTARRQACSAAAFYLDMLDELVRQPGPVGSHRPYQTSTSHNYQVFALTSFGAYWHLLVGYRRPRLENEHADETGMSKTAYIFQRLWSGHVTNKKKAYELLDLVDQIHQWAITEYRTFVLEHLRPWIKLCEQNYLLEWDSIYDPGEDKKRMRTYSETEDLNVPSWVNDMSEPSRRNFQYFARVSLDEAIREHRLRKGKSPFRTLAFHPHLPICLANGCMTTWDSVDALLNHLKVSHDIGAHKIAVRHLEADDPVDDNLWDRLVAIQRWYMRTKGIREYIRARLKKGRMPTAGGYLYSGVQKRRRIDESEFEVEVRPKDVVSYARGRLIYGEVTDLLSED